MRNVVLLGSTGSIGTQALDVIARNRDAFRVVALAAAGSRLELLAAQARDFAVEAVAVSDPAAAAELAARLRAEEPDQRAGRSALPKVLAGPDAAAELAGWPADVVLNGMTGSIGLAPTLAALEAGRTLALANKESLIVGGPLVRSRAAEGQIVPVDSEHSAIAQCLRGGRRCEVARLVLTASGGPFRGRSRAELAEVTVAAALAHPTWAMGPVVTVNSATLVNKGLEVIEAYHLFALKPEEIDVLVHPQSVVHGMVEFKDGSVVAQLGPPDMRVPIAHCLAWPRRIDGPAPRLDLAALRELTFEAPDLVRFPALALARRVLQAGGAAPTVFNAANEVAVAEFLAGRISFPAITALVEMTLDAAAGRGLLAEPADIDATLGVDHIARSLALALLPEIAVKSS